jgi:hypothetical protein
MAILSGKRLGPYEILSAIGAGGMGEVYRILHFYGQELQCDMAVQLQVFRFVHHTHAATAELFQDAIVGDGLADHIPRTRLIRTWPRVAPSKGLKAICSGDLWKRGQSGHPG